ncbi:ABC transporter substrate-binding protein [Agromyces soli]|uniref:ABC transporter substrate-binding protein n=1 Tax=Agromyces soli TaxID=659012 RepID=A0ABY4AWR5_9MICO|nr:ABC transporter substrate-binding protein [Agromyces soli]UOE27638.1 ABC transporter substrate-binding protein [Agromyces soli]
MSMSRRTPRLAGGAAALAAAVLLAGCTAAGPSPSKGTAPELTESLPAPSTQVERLDWALYAEPSSLDPIYPNDFPPMEVLSNVCESLMRIAPDFTIEPALAESFEQPDPLTLVYTLRDGVTFHSGAPLTADDVVYSLNRSRSDELGSFHTAVYANVADIVATAPNEVTITLTAPDQTLSQALATGAGRIVNQASTEAQGTDFGTPGSDIDCTGPYSLASWRAGEAITLERFDDYWDDSLPSLVAEVDFSFVRDPAARVNALLSGEVDGTWGVPASGFARLQGGGQGTLAFGRTSGSYVAMVTSLDGALADPRIRQALAMSIDREGIIAAAVAGAADPLAAPASPGTWGFAREDFEQAYQEIANASGGLEEAKALVAEAGVPSETLTIAVTNSQAEMPIIGAEVQRAAKAIGLEAELTSLPADGYNALYSDPAARDGIDLIFSLWQTDFPDPTQIYQYLESDNFFNLSGWSNAEFDQAIDASRASSDDAERAASLIAAQSIEIADPTWLPIYTPYNAVFLGKGLTGAPTAAVQLNYPWAAMIGGE